MAAKDQVRAAQLAIALRRGDLKPEDVPDDLRESVDALRSQDEDSLADLTKQGGEMRSEAVKRALMEAQKARRKQKQGVLGRLFDWMPGSQ